jgi:hypothetical protein
MTIEVSSYFPAALDTVFSYLQKIETLRYIAAPFARFEPVGPDEVWAVGKTFQLKLKACGFDFGIHTIDVIGFDRTAILTRERNSIVPVWNHRITMRPVDRGMTHYTDRVEIKAGWKTLFICLWANMFYRHRQRRWRKLLNSPN